MLFTEYKTILDSYFAETIIEPVENISEVNTFFLPQRAVISVNKSTSTVGIVFDASTHAKSEHLLKDCLYTVLNLIPELFSLLMKFRIFPVAITADIQKQIKTDEQDTDLKLFFGG